MRSARYLAWLIRLAVLAMVTAALPAGLVRAQLEAGVRAQVPPAIVQIGAIVTVTEEGTETEEIVPRGSGTVVAPDGVVLTNHHVTDLADLRAVLADRQGQLERQGRNQRLEVVTDRFVILTGAPDQPAARRFEAAPVAAAPELDLAVLRIERDAAGAPLDRELLDLPYLQLGDSDTVELGEPVHVFGYPAIGRGLLTYTQGAVSSFDLEDGIAGRAWIKTDATVSGGSSGGAAVNAQGLLIGIPTQAGALECRPGDTNGDGAVDELDVGCVPIGGTLNQLRPVNLAKALLTDVCEVCAPTAGEPFDVAAITIAVGGLAVPYVVQTEPAPLLITLPDGGAMAFFTAVVEADAWRDARRLFVARFDPVRNRWLSSQPLPGGPVQFGPAAVVDSEGVVHLVYSERPGNEPGDLATLMYTRSYGQGLWEPPTPVSPHPNAGNQTRPAIAVDENDRLYLVWLDQRNATADDLLLYPEAADIFFSEQRANVWSAPALLEGIAPAGPDGWLRLVLAGERLIGMWNVIDQGADLIQWTSRAVSGPKTWTVLQHSLSSDDDGSSLMVTGQAKALLGVPQTGEALFATVPLIFNAMPIDLRALSPDASEWRLVSALITYAPGEPEDLIERLSLVTDPSGTCHVIFERGPAERREVTVIAVTPGAVLPSPETIVTAGEDGPQRHYSAALGADGALWILYADIDPEPGAGGNLRVRRWVPEPALATTVEQLLPVEAEVPLPLSPADSFWDPAQIALEAPVLSPDPTELQRKLAEDWFATDHVQLQFDRVRAQPGLREVSIHELESPAAAEAALDFFLNERAAAGGLTEVSMPQYCRSFRGVERYLEGPAGFGDLPGSDEISVFLQWQNLLVRITDVYVIDPEQEFALACPVVSLAMGARLEQVSQGVLPLAAALPDAADTRMVGGAIHHRSRDELLSAGPDRPLDAWGWRDNVTQTFAAPETGLTALEAEVLRLGGPEFAAAAAAQIADDRAAVGSLAEAPVPADLAANGVARLLTGPALTPDGAGQFEATVIVQSHELLFRVTAVSPTTPPIDTAVAVVETMIAKRPPAGHNAPPPE